MTDKLIELAKAADKAIKSGKAYVTGTKEINIWSKHGMAITAFHEAATPEAILALIKEKREMEEFQERVAQLHLRESNGVKDSAVHSVHDAAVMVKQARAALDLRRAARALAAMPQKQDDDVVKRPTHNAEGKRIDGYGDPSNGEYNAFLADDGSGTIWD